MEKKELDELLDGSSKTRCRRSCGGVRGSGSAAEGDEEARPFPDTQSVEKVLYLALMKAKERWTMPIKDWSNALSTSTWLSQDG